MMKNFILILAALLTLAALSSTPALSGERVLDGVVVRVVDGDTVDVLIKYGLGLTSVERIRLLAIDAPEMTGPSAKKGALSKKYLVNLIGGQEIKLVIREKKDGHAVRGYYGRILGRIIFHGQDIGELLLRRGLAKPYRSKRSTGKD